MVILDVSLLYLKNQFLKLLWLLLYPFHSLTPFHLHSPRLSYTIILLPRSQATHSLKP